MVIYEPSQLRVGMKAKTLSTLNFHMNKDYLDSVGIISAIKDNIVALNITTGHRRNTTVEFTVQPGGFAFDVELND